MNVLRQILFTWTSLKGFSTLPDKILLLKLKSYIIRRKVLGRIEAFLTNPKQRVVLRHGSSKWEPVISGVPQGIIFGPLLFLFYINDMPSLIQNTATMFAGDTKLCAIIESREDRHRLQQDLYHLSAWSRKWLLGFNETKCIISKIQKRLKYAHTINGYNLQQDPTQKDLGVLVSDNLNPQATPRKSPRKTIKESVLLSDALLDLNKCSNTLPGYIQAHSIGWSSIWKPNQAKDINSLEKSAE